MRTWHPRFYFIPPEHNCTNVILCIFEHKAISSLNTNTTYSTMFLKISAYAFHTMVLDCQSDCKNQKLNFYPM